jgi:hypothetical protein
MAVGLDFVGWQCYGSIVMKASCGCWIYMDAAVMMVAVAALLPSSGGPRWWWYY